MTSEIDKPSEPQNVELFDDRPGCAMTSEPAKEPIEVDGQPRKLVHIDGSLARELIAGIRQAHPDMAHAAEVIEKYIIRLETIPHEALLALVVGNTEQAEKQLRRPHGFDAVLTNDHGILRVDLPPGPI